ncbi:hypothetical protein Kpol_1066p19, partial [Vanderwaltozyma polyspora DSM 70294]
PECGTEIDPTVNIENVNDKNGINEDRNFPPVVSEFSLTKKYFKLLEHGHRRFALTGVPSISSVHEVNGITSEYFIPQDLFIPGYFHKFFRTLSLLGTGARGSVFKVVHKMGDIELGVFALKKIPIGNDMPWFEKCIREVKALSSLTHESINLITYNHVWLEMDSSCGLVRGVNGSTDKVLENIPCIFILQQYCSGGNLEDVILRNVFKKFPELDSIEERKRSFKRKRAKKDNEPLGLSTNQITSIVRNIGNGLKELHDIGLIHRDLKPSNCLLLHPYNLEQTSTKSDDIISDGFPTVVIGDLGESQVSGEYRTATGATGTLEFTAPEVVIPGELNEFISKSTQYNEYTFASDIYSLGMIMYFIIFGSLPFESELEIVELKNKIKKMQFNVDILVEKHQSMNLKPIDKRLFGLLIKLLSFDPADRPVAAEVDELLNEIGNPKYQNPKTYQTNSNSVEDKHLSDVSTISNNENIDDFANITNILGTKELEPSRQKITINYKINATARAITNRSFPRTLIQSQKLLTKVSSFALCLSLSIFNVRYSEPGSVSSLISLFFLGISINISIKNQYLIITSLLFISVHIFFSDYFNFITSIISP